MNKRISRSLLALSVLIVASLACSLADLTGGPLLQDDFSGDSNWGTGTDSDSSVEYASDALRFQIYRDNYIVWSTPNDEVYENIHVEVTVNPGDSDVDTAFGIICYQQNPITDSYYYMVITPAGDYAIAKAALALTDVFLTNDDQWAVSDLIEKNKSSYRVGADCGNGTLTLYVDGQQIASVNDTTYTSGGVGLQVWSGADVSTADISFDDFVVTKLESK